MSRLFIGAHPLQTSALPIKTSVYTQCIPLESGNVLFPILAARRPALLTVLSPIHSSDRHLSSIYKTFTVVYHNPHKHSFRSDDQEIFKVKHIVASFSHKKRVYFSKDVEDQTGETLSVCRVPESNRWGKVPRCGGGLVVAYRSIYWTGGINMDK